LPRNVVRACPPPADPAIAQCLALIRTDAGSHTKFAGYGPSDLRSAYVLPSTTGGIGQTVAVVDAYDDPKAEKDLAKYRAFYGLSPCSTENSCFRKVNQLGGRKKYPAASSDWAFEEALDIEMVSALCPNCSIILVEANNPSPENLAKAADEAVKLGANVVSNSYIGYGMRGMIEAPHYDHPGVIMTASSGDQGFGISEPAGFPTVVSVGGTKLVTGHNPRGWKETVWSLSGSGCEGRQVKPSWQLDAGCTGRTMNDVAALADPAKGVAVFDSFYGKGWSVGGGTSVGAPLIAAAYALAGNAATTNAAESLYAPGAALWDVTEGSDGQCARAYLCNAGVGYDGPTGNGTPNGVSAF
jgi:subtilase family serine protease